MKVFRRNPMTKGWWEASERDYEIENRIYTVSGTVVYTPSLTVLAYLASIILTNHIYSLRFSKTPHLYLGKSLHSFPNLKLCISVWIEDVIDQWCHKEVVVFLQTLVDIKAWYTNTTHRATVDELLVPKGVYFACVSSIALNGIQTPTQLVNKVFSRPFLISDKIYINLLTND